MRAYLKMSIVHPSILKNTNVVADIVLSMSITHARQCVLIRTKEASVWSVCKICSTTRARSVNQVAEEVPGVMIALF